MDLLTYKVMDIVTGDGNLPWIFSRITWDIINFSIIGLAIIAIIMIIASKDKLKTKIINLVLILIIPYIGVLVYFGRLLFLYLKNRKLTTNI